VRCAVTSVFLRTTIVRDQCSVTDCKLAHDRASKLEGTRPMMEGVRMTSA
jgi:hypothetical protein